MRQKADSAATLVAAAADDYELGLDCCLSFQCIEFYTLLKSYKRIDRHDVSMCHRLTSAHYINNTRRHIKVVPP